jgi:hypothetical protein
METVIQRGDGAFAGCMRAETGELADGVDEGQLRFRLAMQLSGHGTRLDGVDT